MMDSRFVMRTWPTEQPAPWAAVWPESCGRYTVPRPQINRVPSFYCVHLLTKGKIRFRTSPDINIILSPGQMFAVWDGVPYDYRRMSSSQYDETALYWLRLKGPRVREFLEAMGFKRDRPHCAARDPDRVKAIMKNLMNLASAQSDDVDMKAVALLHAMAPACDYVPIQQGPRLSIAESARQLMEVELTQGFQIEEISRALHISRSTLFLHFKKEFGKSPMAVHAEIRIKRARKLLKESTLPISQIAFQSGFTDPLYFSRLFSKEMGMSPREYRRNVKGS